MVFTALHPTLKKHLAVHTWWIFFPPYTIKGVSAATNQKLACKQNAVFAEYVGRDRALQMETFQEGYTDSALRDLC